LLKKLTFTTIVQQSLKPGICGCLKFKYFPIHIYTGEKMKVYPEETLNQDLKAVESMNISPEEKKEKMDALENLYLMQENEEFVERFAIRDYRENILGKDFLK